MLTDFREGEAAGYEGEGLFGFGVFGAVEAGEAEVEAGFEGASVAVGNFGEGDGGVLVVTLGELGLAESEEGRGVVGGFLHGHLEALDALLRGGGVGAADVVFEGA